MTQPTAQNFNNPNRRKSVRRVIYGRDRQTTAVTLSASFADELARHAIPAVLREISSESSGDLQKAAFELESLMAIIYESLERADAQNGAAIDETTRGDYYASTRKIKGHTRYRKTLAVEVEVVEETGNPMSGVDNLTDVRQALEDLLVDPFRQNRGLTKVIGLTSPAKGTSVTNIDK